MNNTKFKDVHQQDQYNDSQEQYHIPIKNLDQQEQIDYVLNQNNNSHEDKYRNQNLSLFSPKSSSSFKGSSQKSLYSNSKMKITVIDQKIMKNKDSVIWKDYWKDQERLSTTLLKIIMQCKVQKLKKILLQNPTNLDRFKYIDDWGLLHFVCNSSKNNYFIQKQKRIKTQATNCQSIQSQKKSSNQQSIGSSFNSSLEKSKQRLKFSLQQQNNSNNSLLSPSQQILQILLKNQCNIEAQTSIKRRPLHIAVIHNSYQKVLILLKNGCKINITDQDFNTPLHYALQFGFNQIVKLILNFCVQNKKFIDFSLENNKKMNIIDCCRDLSIKQFILESMQKLQHKICSEINKNKTYISRFPDNFDIFLVSRCDHIQKLLSCSNYIVKNQIESQSKKNSINMNEFLILKKKKKKIGQVCTLITKITNIEAQVQLSLRNRLESKLIHLIQSLNNYQKIRKLGQGSFGQVYLVRKKRSSNYFALKCLLKKQIIENNLKKYIYMQRKVLIKIKNSFIVHAHSFFQDRERLYMVMQLCYGGDLQQIVRSKKRLSQDLVKMYAAQVALALSCLHQQDILFRDLKPANVLIDGQGHIKIADFGLAKQANISYSFLGSKAYLPPQMLAHGQLKQHNAAIDWYLFGVFIYELLYGRPPFYSPDQARMFKNIKEGKVDFHQNIQISSQCKDLLLKTLQKNPKKRLGGQKDLQQIMNHDWFKDINWQMAKNKKLPLPKPEIDFQELKMKQFMQEPLLMNCQSQDQNQDRRFISWNYYESPKIDDQNKSKNSYSKLTTTFHQFSLGNNNNKKF